MFAFRLCVGFAAVLASCVLVVFSTLATHLAGYVAATLVAFTMAAMARRASLMTATESGKPEATGIVTSVRLLVVAGFVLGVVHAWYIARTLS